MKIYRVLPALFVALTMFFSHVKADADYYLDRVIDGRSGFNSEVSEFANGYAEVFDNGPYTDIEGIIVDVDVCLEVQFSPRPNCEPYSIYINADTEGYWGKGEFYYLADNKHPTLTFIRRGTLETGDAALLLFVDQMVIIFKQVL